MNKPKETFYNGTVYRSRNEAKWARFFDTINIRHIYEPVMVTGWNGKTYKPDFYFPDYDKYAEVKSNTEGIQNAEMASKINGVIDYKSTPISNGLLLLGSFPFDIRTISVSLRTNWLFCYKGVCCANAIIKENLDGCAEIIFENMILDCGDPIPPKASPNIFVEPSGFGSLIKNAINNTNDYFKADWPAQIPL